jgi:hypothetical protein
MKRLYYNTDEIDWDSVKSGDRLVLAADDKPGVKTIRLDTKREAGKRLIGMKWSKPTPKIHWVERPGHVGYYREESGWYVTATVTRRIIEDWGIKDDFPFQTEERVNKNTTTLFEVANRKGD